MGQGWSKRLDDWMYPQRYQYNLPPHPPPLPPSSGPAPDPVPVFSPPPPPPPRYVLPANLPYQGASNRPHHLEGLYQGAVPYPGPQPNGYNYYYQYPPSGNLPGRSNYQYYTVNQGGAWWPSSAPITYPSASSSNMVPQHPPAPYVEHQQAVKIKNNINLHKDTISLRRDEQNPEHWLVSFTFDALLDGSITIYYFAKEGEKCDFVPMYPDIYSPITETFQKGHGQKFCQSSGHGIDLGFFELETLSKPSREDVFPLVVCAKAWSEPVTTTTVDKQPQSLADSGAQITLAVIEKGGGDTFKVKVIKQILWVDGERYELREIFGLASSANEEVDGDDLGKECVICMSEPRDTAVMPCRHMCMCSECAKTFRLHSSNCPICRQPVEELMEIKVNSG
ncbi:RING/U-box superfamily protein [Wolffia australiana]